MNCPNEQQIFDFINNELPVNEYHYIELHLKNCEGCKKIFDQNAEEINILIDSFTDFDNTAIEIPEFVFPVENKTQKTSRITSLIVRLGIAATILILISFSILILNQKKQNNIELQRIQIEQEMLITDLNEAWHERELIITQTDQETGKSEIFLSSDIEK